MSEVALTFPDGSKRSFKKGLNRRRAGRRHLQVAGQEGGGHLAGRPTGGPGRPDRGRRQRQDHHPHRPGSAGADPARRRARDGGSGAVAVARHPGDHRPGDRERLLLRLRQGRSRSIPTISPRSKPRCTRSSSGTRPSPRSCGAATRPRTFFRDKGEMFKVELVDAIPRGRGPEDLQAGRVARPVPRPAHDLDRADRQGLQAHQASRAPTGAAITTRPQLQRIYGTAWATDAGAGGLPQDDRGGREARPPQARPRDGPVPLPGGGAGRGVLAPEGLGAVPGPHQLHPAAAERGRLPRGERAADPRQVAVGGVGPLGDLPREHVHHRHRG